MIWVKFPQKTPILGKTTSIWWICSTKREWKPARLIKMSWDVIKPTKWWAKAILNPLTSKISRKANWARRVKENHQSFKREKIAFKTSDLMKKSLVTIVRAVQKSLLSKPPLQRKSLLNANLITLSAVVRQIVKLQQKKRAVLKRAPSLKSLFCKAKRRSKSKNTAKMSPTLILTKMKKKTKPRFNNHGCLLSLNESKIWLKQWLLSVLLRRKICLRRWEQPASETLSPQKTFSRSFWRSRDTLKAKTTKANLIQMTANSTKMKDLKSSNKLIKIRRWGRRCELKISLTEMLAMDSQILFKINTEETKIILYSNQATAKRPMELQLELRKRTISKMTRNRH